jgi:hypothetical protein
MGCTFSWNPGICWSLPRFRPIRPSRHRAVAGPDRHVQEVPRRQCEAPRTAPPGIWRSACCNRGCEASPSRETAGGYPVEWRQPLFYRGY